MAALMRSWAATLAARSGRRTTTTRPPPVGYEGRLECVRVPPAGARRSRRPPTRTPRPRLPRRRPWGVANRRLEPLPRVEGRGLGEEREYPSTGIVEDDQRAAPSRSRRRRADQGRDVMEERQVAEEGHHRGPGAPVTEGGAPGRRRDAVDAVGPPVGEHHRGGSAPGAGQNHSRSRTGIEDAATTVVSPSRGRRSNRAPGPPPARPEASGPTTEIKAPSGEHGHVEARWAAAGSAARPRRSAHTPTVAREPGQGPMKRAAAWARNQGAGLGPLHPARPVGGRGRPNATTGRRPPPRRPGPPTRPGTRARTLEVQGPGRARAPPRGRGPPGPRGGARRMASAGRPPPAAGSAGPCAGSASTGQPSAPASAMTAPGSPRRPRRR